VSTLPVKSKKTAPPKSVVPAPVQQSVSAAKPVTHKPIPATVPAEETLTRKLSSSFTTARGQIANLLNKIWPKREGGTFEPAATAEKTPVTQKPASIPQVPEVPVQIVEPERAISKEPAPVVVPAQSSPVTEEPAAPAATPASKASAPQTGVAPTPVQKPVPVTQKPISVSIVVAPWGSSEIVGMHVPAAPMRAEASKKQDEVFANVQVWSIRGKPAKKLQTQVLPKTTTPEIGPFMLEARFHLSEIAAQIAGDRVASEPKKLSNPESPPSHPVSALGSATAALSTLGLGFLGFLAAGHALPIFLHILGSLNGILLPMVAILSCCVIPALVVLTQQVVKVTVFFAAQTWYQLYRPSQPIAQTYTLDSLRALIREENAHRPLDQQLNPFLVIPSPGSQSRLAYVQEGENKIYVNLPRINDFLNAPSPAWAPSPTEVLISILFDHELVHLTKKGGELRAYGTQAMAAAGLFNRMDVPQFMNKFYVGPARALNQFLSRLLQFLPLENLTPLSLREPFASLRSFFLPSHPALAFAVAGGAGPVMGVASPDVTTGVSWTMPHQAAREPDTSRLPDQKLMDDAVASARGVFGRANHVEVLYIGSDMIRQRGDEYEFVPGFKHFPSSALASLEKKHLAQAVGPDGQPQLDPLTVIYAVPHGSNLEALGEFLKAQKMPQGTFVEVSPQVRRLDSSAFLREVVDNDPILRAEVKRLEHETTRVYTHYELLTTLPATPLADIDRQYVGGKVMVKGNLKTPLAWATALLLPQDSTPAERLAIYKALESAFGEHTDQLQDFFKYIETQWLSQSGVIDWNIGKFVVSGNGEELNNALTTANAILMQA
jgi:hypothetical protein